MEKIFNYSSLLFVFFIYSVAVLCGKTASSYMVASIEFIFFYGLQIAFLGVYAVLWQFTLKKNKLSVAYMFKSCTIIFGIIFGFFFFEEYLTAVQWIGVFVIFAGIYMVAYNE